MKSDVGTMKHNVLQFYKFDNEEDDRDDHECWNKSHEMSYWSALDYGCLKNFGSDFDVVEQKKHQAEQQGYEVIEKVLVALRLSQKILEDRGGFGCLDNST